MSELTLHLRTECRRVTGALAVGMGLLAGCSRTLRSEPALRTQDSAGSRRASEAEPTELPQDAGFTRAVERSSRAGVAVVELFTSEGCSSCPPADRVLSNLATRAAAQSLPLYTLSFHVDYWNYLGWADRFSSASYSQRQHGYAAINPAGGTYTPQAVVNGEAECVGADAAGLDAFIASALRREARTQVELSARRERRGIALSYRVTGDTVGRVLNLALLEAHAESAVKSGENAGARLRHVNVVRAFTSRPLTAGGVGTWRFERIPELDGARIGVVAYAQDASQRDVSGAAALELE